MDAHSLRQQGWSISAIARHLGRDRKTIRAYLNGERTPGVRAAPPDEFVRFLPYCRQRLSDDPHLWAATLFDEVVELGYPDAYSTFTRALRRYEVRPHCEPCERSGGREHTIIEHPPGAEIQFDWVELPDPPADWGCGTRAHLLVGSLAHSGRWRGVLAESEDFAHFVEALDAVLRRLGATARRWRFDRMATVCYPASGQVTAAFAAVAKYYGVGVDICPPRRGNRKGVVEKANHSAAQHWWRTVPDGITMAAAQSGADKLAARMDSRRRTVDGARTTVGALAEGEVPLALPTTPFPAQAEVARIVSAQALVHFRGNQYSVPPGLSGARVAVRWRLDEPVIRIATAAGSVIAAHERAIDGAGRVVRDEGHVVALERAVLASFSSAPPCRSKVRRPPSAAAMAEAALLSGAARPPRPSGSWSTCPPTPTWPTGCARPPRMRMQRSVRGEHLADPDERGAPLPAVARAPVLPETRRRCRSPAQDPGPGQGRPDVADHRDGAAAGDRGVRDRRAQARLAAALRLPACPSRGRCPTSISRPSPESTRS